MFKIYGIKNCNSMKKAFDALQAKGIDYQFHDYKKQGIERWSHLFEQLKAYL